MCTSSWHTLCIVCAGLHHYLYTDLSIPPPPPICPYYPAAQPRVIALLILSTQIANFKSLYSSHCYTTENDSHYQPIPMVAISAQQPQYSNSPHLNMSTNTSWISMNIYCCIRVSNSCLLQSASVRTDGCRCLRTGTTTTATSGETTNIKCLVKYPVPSKVSST